MLRLGRVGLFSVVQRFVGRDANPNPSSHGQNQLEMLGFTRLNPASGLPKQEIELIKQRLREAEQIAQERKP